MLYDQIGMVEFARNTDKTVEKKKIHKNVNGKKFERKNLFVMRYLKMV